MAPTFSNCNSPTSGPLRGSQRLQRGRSGPSRAHAGSGTAVSSRPGDGTRRFPEGERSGFSLPVPQKFSGPGKRAARVCAGGAVWEGRRGAATRASPHRRSGVPFRNELRRYGEQVGQHPPRIHRHYLTFRLASERAVATGRCCGSYAHRKGNACLFITFSSLLPLAGSVEWLSLLTWARGAIRMSPASIPETGGGDGYAAGGSGRDALQRGRRCGRHPRHLLCRQRAGQPYRRIRRGLRRRGGVAG